MTNHKLQLGKCVNMGTTGSNLVAFLGFLCLISMGFMQCDRNTSTVKVPEKVDFNFDVRPILVQNCYLCHGPDPGSRKSDLRLDTYEGATALRERGIMAIVPGSMSDSELVRRITHSDPEKVMPPPESNLKLSAYEIAVLKKWIDQGAGWAPHWAFMPPENEAPEKFNADESANEIDDYILQKLEEKGLDPVPVADANTLLRRVSYTLTGLPPTVDMIERYSADENPDAYENMVDHYLGSAAFGERWARHWMDVVRYAETKGHEFDYTIMEAWKYRDYLIRAFNADIPFNQIIKEHLAGDLLEKQRWDPETGKNESQIGTMFYTFSEGKHSPVDTKKDEADRIDNMIDVTTKAFQGLTVSCARCHDHKFDPIPTADYYSMYGIMQSSRFSPVPANNTVHKMKTLEEIESIKKSLRNMISREWKDDGLDIGPNALHETTKGNNHVDKNQFEVLGDFRGQDLDGWRSDGLAFGQQSTLGDPVFDEDHKKLLGLAPGVASSRMFSTGIFGAIRSPSFIIDKDFIGIRARGKKAMIRIIIDNFQLIQDPIYGELELKVNTSAMNNMLIDVSPWKGHKAYIELLPGEYKTHVYALSADAFIEAEYVIAFNGTWPDQVENKTKVHEDVRDTLEAWDSGNSTPQEVNALNELLRKNELKSNFKEAAQKMASINQKVKVLEDSVFYSGIYDGCGLDSHVFIRGNADNLSEGPVPRGFLSALTGDHTYTGTPGSGRLKLAEAIAHPENPLTSRVMVNRIWHHIFGKGIVETVDNFGLQGKLPSHPELLDHLALKFISDGWSIKRMIKYIMMSNTFRRAVDAPADVLQKDPDNVLLSHYPLRRLEAEAIYDALLAAAGNLNLEMYGPPVPVYLTDFMQGRGRPGLSGPLDGNGRRSIYHEVRRNFLEPMMLTFDRPIPFTTFGNRNVTNVPAQSLIMMNDKFVIEQAKLMAEDLIGSQNEDETERIKSIYIKALSRYPNAEEIKSALDYLHLLAQSYDLKEQEIKGSIDVWKDYCHSIFNTKEFIYLI